MLSHPRDLEKVALLQEYVAKLKDLIIGELTVKEENGYKLTVEGTLDLTRFLDCYLRTRQEIMYELLDQAIKQFRGSNRTDIIHIIQEMIKEDAELSIDIL